MGQPDAPKQPDSAEEPLNSPAPERVAQAVAALRRLIPEGSNRAILAAMATLAEQGDLPALRAIEAHLAMSPLVVDYGDRDSDPTPWELDRGVFRLLTRWWARLGLAGERGAELAAAWLGDRPLFGVERAATFSLFTQIAPFLAEQIAPPLIAACADKRAARRERAAAGLRYAPADAALDTLVALLADPTRGVVSEARAALSMLAYPPSPGSSRRTPSAPDGVARRLLRALEADAPAVRREAIGCFAWFAGLQHRSSIVLPPHFAEVFPALARLLGDPDPGVQLAAARQIVRAGPNLDNLRPSRVAALGLRLPPLGLLPLLNHPEPEVALAAIYLAGRHPPDAPPPDQALLADQILARFEALHGDPFACPAALYALGRLGAADAIPAIVAHLEQPNSLARVDALLVLGRLRHLPALPQLVRLLQDNTYRADAYEALAAYDDADALPLVLAQLRASPWKEGDCIRVGLWEANYLEAHGDAAALALLRQTESYHFAARFCGAERETLLAAARRLERRLLLAAGLSAEQADDPVATVRRILTGPVHPLECEPRGDAAADHAEQRARWRNLCVALDGWLLADPPPPLGPVLDEAEQLLAGFPDEVREAHERWWLDVTRGGQLGLPRLSAVARATLSPKAPWRLARALTINEGIAGGLDPAAAFAWPGLWSITALSLAQTGWLAALAGASAHLAPRLLRVGLPGEQAARHLAAWPGLARLERLELLWSRALGDETLAGLFAQTMAARRERAWRTPENSYLVPLAFAPLNDSYGGWILRADGSPLAVAASYAELTAAGETLRLYEGPTRYYSPEETLINDIFEVVDGALRRYEWYEAERPAPGALTETVLRSGLAPLDRSALPFAQP